MVAEASDILSKLAANEMLEHNAELDEKAKRLAEIAEGQKKLAIESAVIAKQQQQVCAAQEACIQANASSQQVISTTIGGVAKDLEDCAEDVNTLTTRE